MLQHLHIQNYAIIDDLEVNFEKGLNAITGETGAGKSIVMGALSLILGERADTAVLQNREKKCFVEGTFKSDHKAVKCFLKENDIDHSEGEGDEVLIRREIAANGKSRAFINDTPVSLSLLKQLSPLLVDLHQQFDTLELTENDFQREVLDALANNHKDLVEYQLIFKKFTGTQKELDEWKSQQASANKELDYHKFLFDELDEASFREDEIEQAEASLKLIENSENIKATLTKIYSGLEEGEQPLVQQLKSLTNLLQTLTGFHDNISSLSERLRSAQVELQDIADEVERLNNTVNYDAEKVIELNERINIGNKLLKKHGVTTTAQLLEVMRDLEAKLEKVTNLSEQIEKKEKEVQELKQKATEIAKELSKKREKQVKPFEEKVNKLLVQVGMPNAKIKVSITETQGLNLYGSNQIEFLFDANKSNRFEPLHKVASGGELSRLMLIIKSLVAKSLQLPTLIFDEIDTGISGEAARQVGMIMKELSNVHQVICITHQPQIAAKASAHYYVYKAIKGDRITTSVKLLNPDERITTIATMLAGEKPTAAAFENAREMIGN
jgi:DNA repair protein RecN (Recombination protein N)